MKNTEKNNLLKWNSILWIAAMILPGVFSVAFASTKFPWPAIIPLLLFGPMLASNKMLAQAIDEARENPGPKGPSTSSPT